MLTIGKFLKFPKQVKRQNENKQKRTFLEGCYSLPEKISEEQEQEQVISKIESSDGIG